MIHADVHGVTGLAEQERPAVLEHAIQHRSSAGKCQDHKRKDRREQQVELRRVQHQHDRIRRRQPDHPDERHGCNHKRSIAYEPRLQEVPKRVSDRIIECLQEQRAQRATDRELGQA